MISRFLTIRSGALGSEFFAMRSRIMGNFRRKDGNLKEFSGATSFAVLKEVKAWPVMNPKLAGKQLDSPHADEIILAAFAEQGDWDRLITTHLSSAAVFYLSGRVQRLPLGPNSSIKSRDHQEPLPVRVTAIKNVYKTHAAWAVAICAACVIYQALVLSRSKNQDRVRTFKYYLVATAIPLCASVALLKDSFRFE
jgi:hypothetical protein